MGRWVFVLAFVCGCKSQEAQRGAPRIEQERTEPLTVDEVQSKVRASAEEISTCYRNERLQLNAGALSEYVLQLRIPNDGKPPQVLVGSASIQGQTTLEGCLVGVLARLRFPAHPGKRITLNVPIKEADK
jgi:hypothetical protein